MPRIVDELPKTERGRSKKYDFTTLYKQLADSGKAAELVEGEDFTCTVPSMRQYLYRDSQDNGYTIKVRTRVEDNNGTETGIVVFSAVKGVKEKKEVKAPAKTDKAPAKS